MKAGASSMWASCCGLLNEVMGTGTVRAQQPGFGAGAGPFRFAPSAGYSTYPPTSSGSAGQLCKACGLAFSVFRRKHICCDCKKSFCALCSVLQEDLRCCATCHLLRGTAFQRPRLMQLRVKDLRQYLLLRNIPTDTCREKEDLVDLVLCHQGTRETPRPVVEEEEEEEDEEEDEEGDGDTHEGEEEDDTDSLHSHGASPPSPTRSASEQSVVSASQGVVLSPSDSSGTPSQEHEDTPTASLLNLDHTENIIEVSPATQRRIRASLSDLDNEDAIENLSVRQLKEILARNFVNYSGCCEKWELLERVHRLYRENEQNRKSMENVSITAVVAYPPPVCNSGDGDGVKAQLSSDDNLCRICMDAIIDCVLLECGHMVTCTKCGKRMNECPICRQYVVRAVHVFKS
ncbi:E3 ubiquitin-protein ligase RNF34 isoform X1 [Dunckerocampus dactyliophorus]|uniref:E3 ubiquitin-protein ligase RNF34 isoform X1 n=1 Tax=Dunckerocampus dactyliophorus TaxID=161453 RepID=UPI00240770AF|nr:E3 ubiquitin-protein ligase RNF34 isoform X1 [Dunckerocampus dactyliophorus]